MDTHRFVLAVLIGVLCTNILQAELTDYDRVSLSLGPCFLDVNDPCTSGRISFYLYTRHTKETAVNITVKDTRLPEEYNPMDPTKVIIHGYGGGLDFNGTVVVRRGNSFYNTAVTVDVTLHKTSTYYSSAYERAGNYNIIMVDWGELVRLPCYPTAVLNTIQAGKCTSRLLANVARLQGTDASQFHIVGFSLGAHVASFAGNELERMQKRKVGRITGLDPALPFFASLSKSWKLDASDAEFVDVIHTNVGIFGKVEPTGHVDFYVNEGFSQPACHQSHNIPLCSHTMSLRYYAESILTKDEDGFWGLSCSNYFQHILGWCSGKDTTLKQALMGERCSSTTRGVYYVTTRSAPPYALGRPR